MRTGLHREYRRFSFFEETVAALENKTHRPDKRHTSPWSRQILEATASCPAVPAKPRIQGRFRENRQRRGILGIVRRVDDWPSTAIAAAAIGPHIPPAGSTKMLTEEEVAYTPSIKFAERNFSLFFFSPSRKATPKPRKKEKEIQHRVIAGEIQEPT